MKWFLANVRFAVFVFLPLFAVAAPGTIDQGFGGGTGIVSVNGMLAKKALWQGENRMLLAGYTMGGSSSDFSLRRYLSDGSVDTAFGIAGLVVTSLSSGNDTVADAMIQTDGKVVLVGSTGVSGTVALVRYNDNGSLDTTFNNTGKAIIAGLGSVRAVIEQDDHKLVVVGSSPGQNYHVMLARFNTDGSLDSSFGSAGIINTPTGIGTSYAVSIACLSDGKLLVAGNANTSSGSLDFVLLRYNHDGSMDTNFNGSGTVFTDLNPYGVGSDNLTALIPLADGNVLAAGQTYNYSTGITSPVLVRYLPSGGIDAAFGVGGAVHYPSYIDSSDWSVISKAITRQSDGKLLSLVYFCLNGDMGCVFEYTSVFRFNPDGSMDMTWGDAMPAEEGLGMQTMLQSPSGKLLIAGTHLVQMHTDQLDTDGDGIVDWLDTDNDGDGVSNTQDAFPLSPLEWLDTDADNIGNNTDPDDDGDGIPDGVDANPLNPSVGMNLDGTYKGSTITDSAAPL